MKYFAYGSNVNARQMAQRCPGSVPIGRARLEGFRLVFDGHSRNWGMASAANIVPSPGDSVWGVLYRVSKEDLKLLDGFEHAPKNYRRATVRLAGPGRGAHEAVVYLRAARPAGQASLPYLAAIMRGALRYRFPLRYLVTLTKASGLLV